MRRTINRRLMIGSLVGAAVSPVAAAIPSDDLRLVQELKALIDRMPDTFLKSNLRVVYGAHLHGKDAHLAPLLTEYAQRGTREQWEDALQEIHKWE